MKPIMRLTVAVTSAVLLPVSLLVPAASAGAAVGAPAPYDTASRAQVDPHPETQVGYLPKSSSSRLRKIHGGVATFSTWGDEDCPGEPYSNVYFTWWVRQVTANRAKVVKVKMRSYSNRPSVVMAYRVSSDKTYASGYKGTPVKAFTYNTTILKFGKKGAGRWMNFTRASPRRLEASLHVQLDQAVICGGEHNKLWSWMLPR